MPLGPGVGIIGFGMIGQIHAESIRLAGGRLRGVAIRDRRRVDEFERALGVPVVDDYRRLLERPDIEVVHICTPNALHYAMARDALLADKHVVCEKPLTLTSDEAEDLWRIAEARGRIHAINFNNRNYPLVREARLRLRNGDCGRVVAVRGHILEDSLLGGWVGGWRLDPRLGGDSCAMATIGCHLIDLLAFVLDSPIVSVCADFTTSHPERRHLDGASAAEGSSAPPPMTVPLEEVAHLLVRFASGASGVLCLSQVAAGRRYRIGIEFDGTDAALRWASETPNQLWTGFAAQPNRITLSDAALLHPAARPFASSHGAYPDGFMATIARLLAAVYRRAGGEEAGGLDFPTFADGYRALQVHEAVMESARRQAWVAVSPMRLTPPVSATQAEGVPTP